MTPVALIRLDAGAYSLLDPVPGEGGYLIGIGGTSIVGLYVDARGAVKAVQTAAGAEPAMRPIQGPDGEVTWAGKTFHCSDCFAQWYDLHVRPSAAIH